MRKIKNYENYLISEDGTIINADTNRIKKPTVSNSGKGYLYTDLSKNGIRKRFLVHRLVAMTYIENPENKPYINHIDGNTLNNHVSNLEWCTPAENVEHAAKVIRAMHGYEIANKRRMQPVEGTNLKTGETKRFESINEAARIVGVKVPNIIKNLKGKQSHTKGYIWRYL